MIHTVLRHAASVAALGLCLAAAPSRAADDPVIANLGSQAIKASDIKDFLTGLTPQQREQAAAQPKVMEQIIRSAIGRNIVLDEANKKGWDKTPDVAAQIAHARDEIVIATYLRSVGMPPAAYPSDAELRQAYAENRDRLMSPRQFHLAQIYLAEPADVSKDAAAAIAQKARDLAKRAKAKGADFAALARTNSDDAATAAKGGDLGWVPETQILPEILAGLKANGDKGVTEPIRAAGGWHILSVLGTQAPAPRPLDQVHDQLAAALRESQINRNDQAYVDKLLDDRHLTINETAAAALFETKK